MPSELSGLTFFFHTFTGMTGLWRSCTRGEGKKVTVDDMIPLAYNLIFPFLVEEGFRMHRFMVAVLFLFSLTLPVKSDTLADESVSIAWYACCGDPKTELAWYGSDTMPPVHTGAIATPRPLPDTSSRKLKNVQYTFEWEGVAESEDIDTYSLATARYSTPSEKKNDKEIRVRVQAVFRYRGVGKDGTFATDCDHVCDDTCKIVSDHACCPTCDDTFYISNSIYSPWLERKLTVFGIKEITVRQKGIGTYGASAMIVASTDASDVQRAEIRFEIMPCPPTQGVRFPIDMTNAHSASNHKASISGGASIPADWVNNNTGEGSGDVYFRPNSQYAYATLTPSDVGGRTAVVSSPAGGNANVIFSQDNGDCAIQDMNPFESSGKEPPQKNLTRSFRRTPFRLFQFLILGRELFLFL